MKKIIAITALLIAFAAPAFAMSPIPVDVKITDGIGHTNDRTNTTFSQSETPYVWVKRTDASTVPVEFAGSWWHDPTSKIELVQTLTSTDTEFYMTLDWSKIAKTPGEWTVDGFIVEPGGAPSVPGGDIHYGVGTAKFTFAPEPLSASLFLLGGLGLAMARRRKA